jgi:hypothetical protein
LKFIGYPPKAISLVETRATPNKSTTCDTGFVQLRIFQLACVFMALFAFDSTYPKRMGIVTGKIETNYGSHPSSFLFSFGAASLVPKLPKGFKEKDMCPHLSGSRLAGRFYCWRQAPGKGHPCPTI